MKVRNARKPKLTIIWATIISLLLGVRPESQACQIAAPAVTPASEQQTQSSANSSQAGSNSNVSSAKLGIDEFTPEPKAKLQTTDLTRAKMPVVDVHSHFWVRLKHDPDQLKGFVEIMDRNNIAVCVSLDGRLGRQLDDHIKYLWTEHKDRFVIFANLDWQGSGVADRPETWDCNQPEFARRMAIELERAKELGVSGLKVFKSFGLEYLNPNGSFIQVDDERYDPIWRACGQLELPVLIHTADPSAFFDPITPQNERFEELSRRPEWHFPSDRFPSRASLLEARNRLFAKHPKTTFIAAHFGNDAEDLQQCEELLKTHPNVYLDIASRISELGRQPYSAREFLIKHQDRILFGTDGPWPERRLHSYWRFLETKDEYFPYSEKPIPPQGLWRIYGVYLPDDVLRKIYFENAQRIVPGVAERLEKRR
ncbi:MAG: amidohydrolase family protein [Pirellulales bacterium]